MNKKGVSLMVSYVLIIIIAVSLAVLIYAFLKLYVPKDKPQCPPDVSLVIQDATCDADNRELTITFQNKGLFSVDAVYVRLGESGRIVKNLLNDRRTDKNVYFSSGKLEPGKTASEVYPLKEDTEFSELSTPQVLEIQPAILVNNRLALCNKAVITQTITCINPNP